MNLKDLNKRIALADSQHRAAELVEALDQVDENDAKVLLLDWFNCCDAIGEHVPALRKHFERVGFITDSETLPTLPATVYRATWADDDPQTGLSWTMSFDVAQKFGCGFFGPRAKYVLGLYRPNTDIVIWQALCTGMLAYITSRNECEVIPARLIRIHECARLTVTK